MCTVLTVGFVFQQLTTESVDIDVNALMGLLVHFAIKVRMHLLDYKISNNFNHRMNKICLINDFHGCGVYP